VRVGAKTRVVCKYRERYDVDITRSGRWGNPYSHLKNSRAAIRVRTSAEAVARYREWARSKPDLVAAIKRELQGKVLGCSCDDSNTQPCHGNVLVEIAEED